MTLVIPAEADRTATIAPTCSAPRPSSTAITVVSSGMLLEMRCSKPWAPMRVDASTRLPVRRSPVTGASGIVPCAAANLGSLYR